MRPFWRRPKARSGLAAGGRIGTPQAELRRSDLVVDAVRERQRAALLGQYTQGMRDGVLMMLGLLLSVNDGTLPADAFEEVRFRGELGDEVGLWAWDARRRALEERAGR